MKLIESLIGIEGKYKCNTSSGTYQVEGKLEQDYYGNVSFSGSTTAEAFEAMHREKRIDFYGSINSVDVALLNLSVTQATRSWIGLGVFSDEMSITLSTDYILTGIKKCDNIKVSSITSIIPNCDLKTNSPWFLNYGASNLLTFEVNDAPNDCCITTEYGQLSVALCSVVECSCSEAEVIQNIYARQFKIKCTFTQSTNVVTALDHISSVRNLFSFLTGKCLSLSTFGIEVTVWNDELSETMPCTLFLNDRYKYRFPNGQICLIPLSCIFDNFNLIWGKWISLCEKVPTVVSLYYEIIYGNSDRLDHFLNYARALEVYSSAFREDECKELKKKEGQKGKYPSLCIRIKDILSLLVSKGYLSLSADEVSNLSKTISDMRNYFTHYDNDRGMKISMQEIFAASNVLHLILLILVFDYLGILERDGDKESNDDSTGKKEKVIEAMKKSTQFQYLRTHIDMIANLKDNSSDK